MVKNVICMAVVYLLMGFDFPPLVVSLSFHKLKAGLTENDLPELTNVISESVTQIILDVNHIQVLEKQIFSKFIHLKTFFIRKNGLKSIHPLAFDKTKLKNLWLSNNRLEQVPDLTVVSSTLTHLYAVNNEIGSVENLKHLAQLTHVNLDSNRLTSLPDAVIHQLTALTFFSVCSNSDKIQHSEFSDFAGTRLKNLRISGSVRHLPDVSGTRNTLKLLEARYMKIVNLDVIRNFDNLIHLNLNVNSLGFNTNLSFSTLTNLREISLVYNWIRALDPLCFKGTKLTSLFLHGNRLSELPDLSVVSATLTTINVDNNQISDVRNLETMDNLKYVSLNHNDITSVSDMNLSRLKSLRLFHCHGNKIENPFHPFTFKETKLGDLDISKNLLQAMPELEVVKNSMKKIDARNNRLSNVSSLQPLIHLQRLYLDFNLLESIPEFIFQKLTLLRHFNATHNQIRTLETAVPTSLIDSQPAAKATYIYLNRNFISKLSANSFPGLPGLCCFDISSNILQSVHPYAFNDTKLQFLHINENQLDHIPNLEVVGNHMEEIHAKRNKIIDIINLKYLVKLRVVDVSYNQICSIPKHVISTLSSLQTLLAVGNQLTTLEDMSTVGLMIDIMDNQIICDCRLAWAKHPNISMTIKLNCVDPEGLGPWEWISPEQLVCENTTHVRLPIPSPCSKADQFRMKFCGVVSHQVPGERWEHPACRSTLVLAAINITLAYTVECKLQQAGGVWSGRSVGHSCGLGCGDETQDTQQPCAQPKPGDCEEPGSKGCNLPPCPTEAANENIDIVGRREMLLPLDVFTESDMDASAICLGIVGIALCMAPFIILFVLDLPQMYKQMPWNRRKIAKKKKGQKMKTTGPFCRMPQT